MTAEIAILNRIAVVMAADSAVTVRIGSQEKVYNTADKIFEICDDQPIGLMIYNSMDFMGVPWEVLIRKFRAENTSRFKNIGQAAEVFIDFISKDYPTDNEREVHFRGVVRSLFESLSNEFFSRLRKGVYTVRGSRPSIYDNFLSFLKEMVEYFENTKRADSMSHVDYQMFCSDYRPLVLEEISGAFVFPVDDASAEVLVEISYHCVGAEYASDLVTGLVFAGFGEKELFPSLECWEIDGFYFGKAKVMKKEAVDIDRKGRRAVIIPFAQREMVDRFLAGIDLDLQCSIETYIENAVKAAVEQIIEAMPISKRKKYSFKKELVSKMGCETRKNMSEDFFRNTKRKYLQDVNDMVMFMPKPEMVTLAESLVNFTSIKRRVSSEQETVGGPVDVAVISASEGFVWVRRKHYFPTDRNHRYFARVSRMTRRMKNE